MKTLAIILYGVAVMQMTVVIVPNCKIQTQQWCDERGKCCKEAAEMEKNDDRS